MAKRSYTDTERQDALRLFADLGASETAELTGIPRGTIRQWAQNAGIRSDDPSRTGEARKAAGVRISFKRELLREALLDRAIAIEERMDEEQEVTLGRGESATTLILPKPDARSVQFFANALSTVLDKFRLESGEHTEHTKQDGSPRVSLEERLDELSERRQQKTA